MIIEDLREYIAEGNPEALVFDNPSFDRSIIGTDIESGCVIYDYHKMVEELMEDDNISDEEAADFISYNTIRSLPYMPASGRPIILDRGFIEDYIS